MRRTPPSRTTVPPPARAQSARADTPHPGPERSAPLPRARAARGRLHRCTGGCEPAGVSRPRPASSVPVSVVVSTLDRPLTLARCLDALLSRHGPARRDRGRRPGGRVGHGSRPGRASRRRGRPRPRAPGPPGTVREPERRRAAAPAARRWPSWTTTACRTSAGSRSPPAEHAAASEDLLITGRVLPLPPDGDRTLPLATRDSTERRALPPTTLPWQVGTGGNFSVTRSAYLAVGGNDEQLGTGSPGRAGNDLDLFHRLLRSGVAARYEPDLLVLHERSTPAEYRARRWTYGFGVGACVGSWLRAHDRSAVRILRAWLTLRLAACGPPTRERRRRGPHPPGHGARPLVRLAGRPAELPAGRAGVTDWASLLVAPQPVRPVSPESPPSLSVVVPAYNAADTLGEALESVLDQRPAPLEVIVSDDGSEDDTGRVAAEFGDRVRIVRGPNRGPATARNRAVAVARGDAHRPGGRRRRLVARTCRGPGRRSRGAARSQRRDDGRRHRARRRARGRQLLRDPALRGRGPGVRRPAEQLRLRCGSGQGLGAGRRRRVRPGLHLGRGLGPVPPPHPGRAPRRSGPCAALRVPPTSWESDGPPGRTRPRCPRRPRESRVPREHSAVTARPWRRPGGSGRCEPHGVPGRAGTPAVAPSRAPPCGRAVTPPRVRARLLADLVLPNAPGGRR